MRVPGFRKLADFALPAADKDGSATGPGSSQQIGDSVSNQVALLKRHLQIRRRLFEQADLRLAAMTALPEPGVIRFGMVQAIINSMDAPTRCANSGKHHTIEGLQHFRFQVSFGDSRLIGDDGHAQAEIVQQADGFRDAGKQLELRLSEGRINHASLFIVDKLVDYTIAIE